MNIADIQSYVLQSNNLLGAKFSEFFKNSITFFNQIGEINMEDNNNNNNDMSHSVNAGNEDTSNTTSNTGVDVDESNTPQPEPTNLIDSIQNPNASTPEFISEKKEEVNKFYDFYMSKEDPKGKTIIKIEELSKILNVVTEQIMESVETFFDSTEIEVKSTLTNYGFPEDILDEQKQEILNIVYSKWVEGVTTNEEIQIEINKFVEIFEFLTLKIQDLCDYTNKALFENIDSLSACGKILAYQYRLAVLNAQYHQNGGQQGSPGNAAVRAEMISIQELLPSLETTCEESKAVDVADESFIQQMKSMVDYTWEMYLNTNPNKEPGYIYKLNIELQNIIQPLVETNSDKLESIQKFFEEKNLLIRDFWRNKGFLSDDQELQINDEIKTKIYENWIVGETPKSTIVLIVDSLSEALYIWENVLKEIKQYYDEIIKSNNNDLTTSITILDIENKFHEVRVSATSLFNLNDNLNYVYNFVNSGISNDPTVMKNIGETFSSKINEIELAISGSNSDFIIHYQKAYDFLNTLESYLSRYNLRPEELFSNNIDNIEIIRKLYFNYLEILNQAISNSNFKYNVYLTFEKNLEKVNNELNYLKSYTISEYIKEEFFNIWNSLKEKETLLDEKWDNFYKLEYTTPFNKFYNYYWDPTGGVIYKEKLYSSKDLNSFYKEIQKIKDSILSTHDELSDICNSINNNIKETIYIKEFFYNNNVRLITKLREIDQFLDLNFKDIKNAEIKDGNLIITLSDDSEINVGHVVGPQGETGLQGEKGDPGFQGLPGKDGVNGKDGAKGDTGDKGEPGTFSIENIENAEYIQGLKASIDALQTKLNDLETKLNNQLGFVEKIFNFIKEIILGIFSKKAA